MKHFTTAIKNRFPGAVENMDFLVYEHAETKEPYIFYPPGTKIPPKDQIQIKDLKKTETDSATVQTAKEDRHDHVKLSCRREIEAGFDSDALGSSYHYPMSDKDQTNLHHAILFSLLPNNEDDWTTAIWCMENKTQKWAMVPHTVEQVHKVAKASKKHVDDARTKKANLADKINKAKTADAVHGLFGEATKQKQ